MLLLIDNYDSFTYNLKDYFEQLGEECMVIRNDELAIEQIQQISFDKIVLSPGPEKPANAGVLTTVIKTFHKQYPILGICLGHQAIGEFFGLHLQKANYPMHGKVSTIQHNGDVLFKGIPQQYDVCRYHSLLLSNSNTTALKTLAIAANNNEVMAIKHMELPIWGVQFHPEAILTQHGLQLLNNWLQAIQSETVGI